MSFNPNIGILPSNNPYAWNADRDALNVGKNFKSLGSFWTEQMSDDNKSQKLLDSYSPNDITYVVDKSGTKTYKCIINEDDKSATFILDESASLGFTPSNIITDTTGSNFYKIELDVADTDDKKVTLYKLGTKPEDVDPTNYVFDKEGNICWKLIVDNTTTATKSNIYFSVNFRGRPEKGGRTHAKVLSNISLRTNGLSKIENAKNNILNDPYNLYLTNGSYKFQSSQVYKQNNADQALVSHFADSLHNIRTGAKFTSVSLNNEILVSNVGQLNTYSGAINILSTDSLDSDFYEEDPSKATTTDLIYVYFSEGIEIIRIYTDPILDSTLKPETLLPGLDFIQLDNAICFINKNPYRLFKDQTIYFDGRYLSTAKDSESLYRGLCSIEHVPCGLPAQLTTNYVKGSTQSVKDFELMLNALAGSSILMNGPAKVIYVGETCDKPIYYSQFQAQCTRTDSTSATYSQLSFAETGKNRPYYVLQNIITKETFVVKPNIPRNLNCLSLDKDTDFKVGDVLPQYYVFNSPIKLVYNQSNGKASKNDLANYKTLFENVVSHNNQVEQMVAPAYFVKTIIPDFEPKTKVAFFSKTVNSRSMSATIAINNSDSYWYWETCPVYEMNPDTWTEFAVDIDNTSNISNIHSEGELVLSHILPNALLICLSNQPLEYLYMRQYNQSDYFKHKFPTFTSFIYFFNNLVKRFAPLSYIPIVLLNSSIGESTTIYSTQRKLRSGITTKNVRKFFMLSDIQAFEKYPAYLNNEFSNINVAYNAYRPETYKFQ